MKVANYNYQQDLSKVILWQYDNTTNFKGLVDKEQEFMDENVTQFWQNFNRNIFNLATCNTFGLELWGKLLNVARPTYIDHGVEYEYNNDQYRLVLQSRIYVLTFDGSAKALNTFFSMLLPEYPVIITDNYDMTVDISFYEEPPAELKIVLSDEDFLPRPSGVQYNMNWSTDYSKVFGFEGMKNNNVNPPSFTDKDAGNYDPDTDAGGIFYQ